MSLPTFINLYKDLIALPSISSTDTSWDQSNLTVINQLATWLEELGFHNEITEVPNVAGKYNLVSTYGSGDGGLLLAGHTDTVPYDEAGWETDPFKVVEKDNRLYGLGTIDMKGFLCLCHRSIKNNRSQQT